MSEHPDTPFTGGMDPEGSQPPAKTRAKTAYEHPLFLHSRVVGLLKIDSFQIALQQELDEIQTEPGFYRVGDVKHSVTEAGEHSALILYERLA